MQTILQLQLQNAMQKAKILQIATDKIAQF